MSRAIAFLALLAMLTLRFVDGAAHMDAHAQEGGSSTAVVLLDASDDGCGADDLHASAHCASHMAEALQRSLAPVTLRAADFGTPVPIARSVLDDGRVLSPPVPPPLA
jgi:hypothetical protein